MATIIVSSNQPVLNTASFDRVAILDNVVISGTWNMASDGDGSYARGDVYGRIFGGIVNRTVNSERSDLFIAEGGLVTRIGGSAAIDMAGGGNDVVNHGSIGGNTTWGILFDEAGASTVSNKVRNFGTISGSAYGIESAMPDRVCNIDNFGTIESRSLAVDIGQGTLNNHGDVAGGIRVSGTGTTTIVNSGLVLGSFGLFGSQANIKLDTRSGTWDGNITSGNGADVIYGSAAADNISTSGGADFIDGHLGADFMSSTTGNDVFVVDDAGDVVSDSSGVDTIRSHISYDLTDTSAVNSGAVEILRLMGTADLSATGGDIAETITGNVGRNHMAGGNGDDSINGKAGADTLLGEGGNDILDGGKGGDAMEGGAGNDSYYIDNIRDTIDESIADGAGIDTVFSAFSHSLTANAGMKGTFENLSLTGTGDTSATGNGLANIITGNAGKNNINGLSGNDILTGGGNEDRFVFSTVLNSSTNADTVTDFEIGVDKIVLDDAVFNALPVGALSANNFVSGPPEELDDVIVYDKTLGKIFYDADGKDTGEAVLFATVTAGLALTEADFFVV